jgi:hypothetical protein
MENKQEFEIDLDKLIVRTYNKIAIWNNQSASDEEKSIMLKVLSHEIVTDIINTTFSQLNGVKTKEKITTLPPKKNILNKFFHKNKFI